MAFELTVYASGRGYPRLRKTRFRLVANLYRVGLLTHWVALKGFYLFQAPRLPPFLGFAWRDGVRVAGRWRQLLQVGFRQSYRFGTGRKDQKSRP